MTTCVIASAGSPFGPSDVARMIHGGGERVPDPASGGRLEGTLAGPDGDWTYDPVGDLAVQAVPMLGLDPEQVGNYVYGKVLEYVAPSPGIDWHHDHGTSRGRLGETVLVGSGPMKPWQIEEMNGRTVSAIVQLGGDFKGGELEIEFPDGPRLVS